MDFFNSIWFIILLLLFILIETYFISRVFNIIYVILLLLLIYIQTGLLFLICFNEFLAYMFLIIYAGAIVILFIYVLMLINIKKYKKIYFGFYFFNFFFVCLLCLFYFIFVDSYLIENYIYINNLIVSNQTIYLYIYLKFLISIYSYNLILDLNEFSDLVKFSVILFNDSFIETLFIGLLLLLGLIYIIYLFKK